MRFSGCAASDVGAQRSVNEDAAFFGATGEMALAIVADGMGGGCSGRPAADLSIGIARAIFARRFAVLAETWWAGEHGGALPADERRPVSEHVRALLRTRRAETLGDAAVLERGLGDLVRSMLVTANQAIWRRSQEDRRWRGMGAAVVAAVFAPGAVAIAHAGDSRIYRLREGRLEQLTRDHSLVNEYLRAKPDLTPEQIEELPKNVIVRALGMSDAVEPEVAEHALGTDEEWLFLSDGVFEVLDEARIVALVEEHGARAGGELVEAGRHTATDNLSSIVVSIAQ